MIMEFNVTTEIFHPIAKIKQIIIDLPVYVFLKKHEKYAPKYPGVVVRALARRAVCQWFESQSRLCQKKGDS